MVMSVAVTEPPSAIVSVPVRYLPMAVGCVEVQLDPTPLTVTDDACSPAMPKPSPTLAPQV